METYKKAWLCIALVSTTSLIGSKDAWRVMSVATDLANRGIITQDAFCFLANNVARFRIHMLGVYYAYLAHGYSEDTALQAAICQFTQHYIGDDYIAEWESKAHILAYDLFPRASSADACWHVHQGYSRYLWQVFRPDQYY